MCQDHSQKIKGNQTIKLSIKILKKHLKNIHAAKWKLRNALFYEKK